jgi:hypothetical protein
MNKLNKKKLAEFAKHLSEQQDGLLEGGFKIISFENNSLFLGGDQTNNCNGGNCVQGCGQNTVSGCGGKTNTVPHCGT